MNLFGFALGIGTKNKKGDWLEVYYPSPRHQVPGGEIDRLASHLGYKGGNVALEIPDGRSLATLGEPWAQFAQAKKPLVATFLESDDVLQSVPEAYLKLHFLSHRFVRPHEINLTGIFKVLPNVAWTSRGPIDPEELADRQCAARLAGETLEVRLVDKFPPMTDYVVPSGVRIADSGRVRLGAYVGPGTTVMQEGFINFNAGTEGPNMIEGRVSSSVWVGAGSDLGGGCSTMGVLSGGNSVPISVGARCLIGANAGVGIPLGDDCTVEAGLYVTAASKVNILSRDGIFVKSLKARDLAGRSNLLFRRNSLSGAIECLPNKASIELNHDLHAHN